MIFQEVVLRDEIATLEAQRKEDEMEKRRIEDAYTERVNGVSQELGFARSQVFLFAVRVLVMAFQKNLLVFVLHHSSGLYPKSSLIYNSCL